VGLLVPLIWAAPVAAQGTDEFGAFGGLEDARHLESPQNFAVELRVGPYTPNVDDEFSSATPYQDVFGDSTRIMLGGEFDWQALELKSVGNLGLGVGLGITWMTGRTEFADGSGLSAETTTLTILPAWAVAVLRIDALARQTSVPLVPYGKAGLASALWWVTDGDGAARDDEGGVGKGRADGWMVALGLMLDLGFIDLSAERHMDAESGINHSYLFGELMSLRLNGFGSDTMEVGADTWLAGLAFEF
jgi:hypothetical protein